MPIRPFVIAGTAVALACAPGNPPPMELPDAGEVTDAGLDAPDAGGHAHESTWTYLPIDGAKCGNGTDTGIGVNVKPDASTLLVYMQGGGACWEVGACYILQTATHVETTVQETIVLRETQAPALDLIFDRDDETNPFRDAHLVYVPYCTGDLHAGARVKRYEWLGQTRDLHHVGGTNAALTAERLAAAFPGVERIVLLGTSAGGFGVLMNAWRYREAFGPDVRIDVLNDSGLPVPMAWDRFGGAMTAWNTQWPPGCEDCETKGFPALLPHYASLDDGPARLGVLAYRQDQTIQNYFGVTANDIRNSLDAQKTAASPTQRFFMRDGTEHVVLATPNVTADGVSAREWLHLFADVDAEWDHAGP